MHPTSDTLAKKKYYYYDFCGLALWNAWSFHVGSHWVHPDNVPFQKWVKFGHELEFFQKASIVCLSVPVDPLEKDFSLPTTELHPRTMWGPNAFSSPWAFVICSIVFSFPNWSRWYPSLIMLDILQQQTEATSTILLCQLFLPLRGIVNTKQTSETTLQTQPIASYNANVFWGFFFGA